MDNQETAKDRQGPRASSDVAGGPYKPVSPNFVHEIENGVPHTSSACVGGLYRQKMEI